ncbi:MAG: NAD(P)-dependent malic enzyme [Nitrososphaerota archaeon]
MTSENIAKKALSLHKRYRGKISIANKIPNLKQKDMQLIYTPGVAAVSRKVFRHPAQKYLLTSKANNVAIITDGTRLLGLGNVGPYAAMPVMEGKSLLYKKFGGVDAYPLCLNATKKEDIVSTVIAIEPAFAAINLEDIEFPKVIEISEELEKKLSIPIFHDDRHGTSVVVLAALYNSLRLVKKRLGSIKIIVAGAGSAGYGIAKLLRFTGCRNIIVVDSTGAIYSGRKEMTRYKKELARITNPARQKGTLCQVLSGADVFIGVSGVKSLLDPKIIKTMNGDPIIFALTNPDPEISPKAAKKAGAGIVATGSYQYQNSVNNALVFPYLMRAILDHRIRKIDLGLLLAASRAIAKTVSDAKISRNHIIPEIGDRRLQKNITAALAKFKSS